MSWEEDKEFTESKVKVETKELKAWQKNLLAGAICFTVGLSAPFVFTYSTRAKTKEVNQSILNSVKEENRSLKKQLKELQENIVTVPVYITESIQTTEEPAPVETKPVTEVPKETKAVETKPAATESEEDNSDHIREITNPLTKLPPSKVKPPAPAQYTIYWIDAERSDLAGMTADDFSFFLKYINKEYNTDDNVYFYVRLTDYPDIIMEFFIPDYGMMSAIIGVSKEDPKDHTYRMEYDSCYMDFDDPSQIKLTGVKKDEYKLPVEDEDEVYYFSEFNEDMFKQIQKFQEHAKFLWG